MNDEKIVDVKIGRDPLALGVPLYKRATAHIKPGLTVLVGCNGAGKSTFIRTCKQFVKGKRKEAAIFDYNNLSDGTQTELGYALIRSDRDRFFALATASEGEGMCESFGTFANKMGRYFSAGSKSEAWVFIDALDSGLSIDNIINVKDFFSALYEYNPSTTFYIIVSANGYELARGENCFDVSAMKYCRFESYEEYRSFIIESRKKKELASE